MLKTLKKLVKFILWSILSTITIIPIYWMFVVSTRSPVELFEKPDFSPTFFEKIYWKNFTKPFIDGVYAEYLWNSIIVASCNAILVTILAIMATYALSRWKLAAGRGCFSSGRIPIDFLLVTRSSRYICPTQLLVPLPRNQCAARTRAPSRRLPWPGAAPDAAAAPA